MDRIVYYYVDLSMLYKIPSNIFYKLITTTYNLQVYGGVVRRPVIFSRPPDNNI